MTMSRKSSDRLRKITDVAARLFASQGYHGTNTREIAQLASVSENTVFRYFASKEELFWAVLDSRLQEFQLGADLIEGVLSKEEPRKALPVILTHMVDAVILNPEMLRLLAIAFIELRSKGEAVFSERLLPSFAALNRYLNTNIQNGKLRALDSSLLTVALSSVLLHPELGRLIGGMPPYANRREAVRTFTSFWLDLLVPAPVELAESALSKTP